MQITKVGEFYLIHKDGKILKNLDANCARWIEPEYIEIGCLYTSIDLAELVNLIAFSEVPNNCVFQYHGVHYLKISPLEVQRAGDNTVSNLCEVFDYTKEQYWPTVAVYHHLQKV